MLELTTSVPHQPGFIAALAASEDPSAAPNPGTAAGREIGPEHIATVDGMDRRLTIHEFRKIHHVFDVEVIRVIDGEYEALQ